MVVVVVEDMTMGHFLEQMVLLSLQLQEKFKSGVTGVFCLPGQLVQKLAVVAIRNEYTQGSALEKYA